MDSIIQSIATVGFPIVACMGTAFFIYQDSKIEREENAKREERFFLQIENFNSSLNKFNATLESIDRRLSNIEEKVGI